MGFKDFFSPGKERELTLDIASLDKWPEKLIRQQRLNDVLVAWLKDVDRCRERASEAKGKLTDPRLKAKKVPERGVVIYEEHVKIIVERVEDLLKAVPATEDLFTVEEQQDAFREALKLYQEGTRKSTAALKEYLGLELQALSDALRALEDAVLSITAKLDEGKFSNIKALKAVIGEYNASRQKEGQLQQIRKQLRGEIDGLEGRKRKIKEKIAYYIERAKTSAYKDLIAEEEQLLEKVDEVKTKFLPAEQEEAELKPHLLRLAFLRKQMITDITSMNINEQRSFVEAVKDDLRLRKKRLERVDEVLATMSFTTYRSKFASLVEPFKVRIEDAHTIVEADDDDVAPQ